jgi:hypothetical protein
LLAPQTFVRANAEVYGASSQCMLYATFHGGDNRHFLTGEELNGPAVNALGVRSQKLSNVGRTSNGCHKIYFLELLRASEGTLSRWSQLYLQSFVSGWVMARFSRAIIHKKVCAPAVGILIG